MSLKQGFILLFAINLTGCAHYGNFAAAPVSLNQAMANDSARQLVVLYPPARTQLNVKQPIRDPYGLSLIKSLRLKGYSVMEAQTSHRASGKGHHGLDFRYVVDSPIKGRLYRVTIRIGQQSISRAYVAQNGLTTPLGVWVRKE